MNEPAVTPTLGMYWARQKISSLLDEQRMSGDVDHRHEHTITTLALDVGLVTPYTSFVAVENRVTRDRAAAHAVAVPNVMPAGNKMLAIAMPQGAAGIHTLAWLGALTGLLGAFFHGARPSLATELGTMTSRIACARVSACARVCLVIGVIMIGLAGVAIVQAGWMAGKAQAAQWLLERAWSDARDHPASPRPWPWADITPVARLSIENTGLSRLVLQDTSGEALAFGPGPVAGVPEQAMHATVVLGGHRDSHFAVLQHLSIGTVLQLEDRAGVIHRYRLFATDVVDIATGAQAIATDRPGLVLITCFPFTAVPPGGTLRFVASARLIVAPA